MTPRKKLPEAEQKNAEPTSSKAVTPKGLPSKTAASKDVKARKTTAEELDEKQEEMLDDAVEMTFPASDPIAIPTPDRVNRQKGKGA